jgi:hypothetical protein
MYSTRLLWQRCRLRVTLIGGLALALERPFAWVGFLINGQSAQQQGQLSLQELDVRKLPSLLLWPLERGLLLQRARDLLGLQQRLQQRRLALRSRRWQA